MSKASSLFKQYVWLVDTIRRARRISLADLSDRWQLTDLSHTSVYHHLFLSQV